MGKERIEISLLLCLTVKFSSILLISEMLFAPNPSKASTSLMEAVSYHPQTTNYHLKMKFTASFLFLTAAALPLAINASLIVPCSGENGLEYIVCMANTESKMLSEQNTDPTGLLRRRQQRF